MSNRGLRFVIALLAIGAAGAAGYRIFQQEQRLVTSIASARGAEQAAETAIVSISELKAALHAYVAEGQGDAFWTARAATLIDRLRASILELDKSATAAGVALTETLDLADRLGAAEQRAREHVREGQRLLAGEVIFTESRDLLDAMRLQIVRTRTTLGESADASHAGLRREQALLAIGAGGILAFAALLLVIPGSAPAAPLQSLPTRRAPEPAADDFESSARVVSRVPVAKPAVTVTPKATPVARVTPTATPPATPTVSLSEAAAVCTDLGRVSQSIEITALLERAAKVLNASGAVVWMATPDRHEMYPAASAGYDERLLLRIGAIKRDANNVTASALRDGAPRTSQKAVNSAAALAVPLMTPLGPVGVFSAELKEVTSVDETRLAVATIFAAQLASLLGSMSTSAAADAPPQETPAAAKAQA